MRKALLGILSVWGLSLFLAPAACEATCSYVTLSVVPSTVPVHTTLTGTMTVKNCASEREVVSIKLTVKNDTTGITILRVDAGTIDLPPGQSKSLSLTLNAATATPGSYHATAIATVDGLQVGSATVTFTVTQ